jgi:hypothetical protein
MAQNPFEGLGREFSRAMEEHGRLLNEEMKRIQQQMQPAIELMKEEMERVGAELQRAMKEFHQRSAEAGGYCDAEFKPVPVSRKAKPPKKRPRRKPPGSASAPVKPRPKPTPLMDGAEAPVE